MKHDAAMVIILVCRMVQAGPVLTLLYRAGATHHLRLTISDRPQSVLDGGTCVNRILSAALLSVSCETVTVQTHCGLPLSRVRRIYLPAYTTARVELPFSVNITELSKSPRNCKRR